MPYSEIREKYEREKCRILKYEKNTREKSAVFFSYSRIREIYDREIIAVLISEPNEISFILRGNEGEGRFLYPEPQPPNPRLTYHFIHDSDNIYPMP